MIFSHPEIDSCDPRTKEGLRSLLAHLCGDALEIGCKSRNGPEDCGKCQACANWGVLSERLKLESLRWEDLNDILVLVDQSPVSETFFGTFLSQGKREITFDELKAGVAVFEGFAILLFGNVRFAYRKLKNLEGQRLHSELLGLNRPASGILGEEFRPRRKSLPLPAEVDEHCTWLLGYIARTKVDRDIIMNVAMAVMYGREDEEEFLKGKKETERKLYSQLKDRLASGDSWRHTYSNFDSLQTQINKIQDEIEESRRRGCLNTSHYLASDYMDVYVATSMRERWEFEDVHSTASQIFAHPVLQGLNLRYFDPTQSFLDNRIDKGLVGALMLKRARCTIYMAQETDTFGKDSELAATLAQGKPVIVFVPEIIVEEHSKVASLRPLAYLQRRLPQLLSEYKIETKSIGHVLGFLQETASFDPYFQIVGEEEKTFLDEHKLHQNKAEMCEILAKAEKALFDSRASALQKSHPLGLQVHLDTGVANGVLVVRSVSHCAELLEKL
jgi:hypothetical protein